MNLLQQNGAQPNKSPKYVPIFVDRMFTGIWTQRSVLHDPSDLATYRFYGGRPDALWQGSNVELTNNLTLKRRPGLSQLSSATYPTPPDRFFAFELTNGTIQLIVDTGSSPTFAMDQVVVISGVAYYYFTLPQSCAAGNAYAGLIFNVQGFDLNSNNGAFTCVSSTSTYMILANTTAQNDSASATAISAGAVYYDQQNGLKTLLFAKSAGAGQTGFVAVAGTLYMGDGIDTRKYTPGNPNGTVWNYSIAAPTSQPGVVITQSAASSVVWQANSYYSTMGLIVDANNNVQQLYTVNADGSNPTSRYGTSSNGQPAWNQALGGTTTDGGVTWTNQGAIGLWAPNTVYQSGQPIYVPSVNCIFIMTHNYAAKSGPSQPAWNPALVGTGARTIETSGGAKWGSLGVLNANPSCVKSWAASKVFSTYVQPSSGSDPTTITNCIIEPTLILPPPAGQTVYLQAATTGGTTGSGATPPTWATTPGQTTNDGQLGWIMLSSATWAATTNYNAWVFGSSIFSVIKDANGNLQVCTTQGVSATIIPGTSTALTQVQKDTPLGGQATYKGTFTTAYPTGSTVVVTGFSNSGNNGTFVILSSSTTQFVVLNTNAVNETHAGTAVYNAWGTKYGAQTTDGTTIWTCVGASVAWANNAIWYLPIAGFSPPSSSQPYGGASVIDTNSPVDLEFVISSGKSGASAPSWAAIGSNTTDNTITWYNEGVAPTQSLVWTTGHVYAYSYKARTPGDFYVTNIPPGANPSTPLGAYTGSGTGGISTASPVYTITGANTGAVNTISGLSSTDPQVDTIVIWRDADGGGSDNMFELTEIPNPPPIGGQPVAWSFQDFLPDVPTSVFPGLNPLIPAPIDDSNDPPPTNFIPMVYNFQRIWGASGQVVAWSGGPDVITGNPNEAYNPIDNFPYLANVVRIIKNSQGLVVFVTDSVEFIGGGPLTSSFFTVTLSPGIGMTSFNQADIYAGEIFFFSSDSQFKSINPSLQLSNLGFAIGDQLANMNSFAGYVAVHQAGIDNAIYVADGSTGWWRCNPHQSPQNEPIWSPFANITNGAGAVQSVEVSPGIKKLLVGGTSCNQPILKRDLTLYTDNGTPYDAYFVMGSITLAHPGELAVLRFIEGDFSAGFTPTVGYLLNEIAGTFTNMVNPVFDPPSIYGTRFSPTSYQPLRYYFSATAELARCRHMQIKIDFGVNAVGGEIYNLTIFGRLMTET